MNDNILIDPKKVPELLKKNYQFIDIRNPMQFQQEHLIKFRNIPYEQFQSQLSSLDKNYPIVLLCYSGAQSLSLARTLNAQGYHCFSISGGFYTLKAAQSTTQYF